jgi:signal transduction histidine kinase
MLSGLLHDVRTPMTIASGYVQLMDQSNDPQARSRHAAIVGKQFELMETMAREVLQFARGQRSLLVRKVYVHKFFEQVGEHLGQLFAGRNIELRLEAGYRDVAYFDEIKLLRVIHNLGRNAAEAMPQGGLFRASVEADGEDLVWRFADSGSGIAEDLRVRLFRPFLEGGKRGGFGLGLALVKKIVEEHQGEVSCASQPGCGTTFTIRMPLRGPAGAAQGDGRSGRSE